MQLLYQNPSVILDFPHLRFLQSFHLFHPNPLSLGPSSNDLIFSLSIFYNWLTSISTRPINHPIAHQAWPAHSYLLDFINFCIVGQLYIQYIYLFLYFQYQGIKQNQNDWSFLIFSCLRIIILFCATTKWCI